MCMREREIERERGGKDRERKRQRKLDRETFEWKMFQILPFPLFLLFMFYMLFYFIIKCSGKSIGCFGV